MEHLEALQRLPTTMRCNERGTRRSHLARATFVVSLRRGRDAAGIAQGVAVSPCDAPPDWRAVLVPPMNQRWQRDQIEQYSKPEVQQ